ncbi:hypothetical protein GW17_00022983 [Ensete ventricosum]|nr:hypothetical protein GW17_00022983 [Ensete ventricosum]
MVGPCTSHGVGQPAWSHIARHCSAHARAVACPAVSSCTVPSDTGSIATSYEYEVSCHRTHILVTSRDA